MDKAKSALRRSLDMLYLTSGYISAMFLAMILVLIVMQMLARWTGITFSGAADYAGYCMAGASFMGFAYALTNGAHIRVSIALSAMGKYRHWGEIWCFAIGTVICAFLLRYAAKTVYWSWKLGAVSQGQDATPLWIPQSVMVLGSLVLTICFIDHLIRVLVTGDSGIQAELAE